MPNTVSYNKPGVLFLVVNVTGASTAEADILLMPNAVTALKQFRLLIGRVLIRAKISKGGRPPFNALKDIQCASDQGNEKMNDLQAAIK